MESCIFCDIVSGKVPCYTLYEDDLVICFLDIQPVNQGHMLIVPKKHMVDMTEADDLVLSRLATVSRSLGALAKERLGAEGFNLYAANGRAAQQSVFHLHFHVIPRYSGDGKNIWFRSEASDRDSVERAYERLKTGTTR